MTRCAMCLTRGCAARFKVFVQEKTLLEVFFVPFELAPLFPAHFDNNRLPLQPVVVPFTLSSASPALPVYLLKS